MSIGIKKYKLLASKLDFKKPGLYISQIRCRQNISNIFTFLGIKNTESSYLDDVNQRYVQSLTYISKAKSLLNPVSVILKYSHLSISLFHHRFIAMVVIQPFPLGGKYSLPFRQVHCHKHSH